MFVLFATPFTTDKPHSCVVGMQGAWDSWTGFSSALGFLVLSVPLACRHIGRTRIMSSGETW